MNSILEAWEAYRSGTLYVVLIDPKLYIEPPGESREEEAVLRVFASRKACELWLSRLQLVHDKAAMGKLSGAELSELIPKVSAEAKSTFSCQVRVDFSETTSMRWPVQVDVLWSENTETH